ncbi:MAG: adenylyl-sulfate kinase [Euryarchaeota archaeon]|nr:adenylyl-sulfate kinase [Euryarchaeota archaeon]MDE1836287.1 adenylyl-sulfate kinase [Euryarchaeota archaeon]MDE1879085.1 adenylyl-sulfate kinase [Euryarchaeota archaeon]MDE2044317.1 adenylyl-sulfate kinase [Thermoplasmata archaeon]
MTNLWSDPLALLVLVVMALAAAVTNGAVGYGFSTLFTPVAVLFADPTLLYPALVLIELGVNLSLLYREREMLVLTWRRALPVILGIAPGVALGTFALTSLSTPTVRIIVFSTLLPFTMLQILGVRRPVRQEQKWGPWLGTGIGFLYALTTISGPPLAAFWTNQNLGKNEFRCTLAQIRVAETSLTTVSYLTFTLLVPQKALFTTASLSLVPLLALPVIVGVPLGIFAFRSLSRGRFLRVVAFTNTAFIAFGLFVAVTRVSQQIGWVVLFLAVGTVGLLVVRVVRNLPANARVAGPTTPDGVGQSVSVQRPSAPHGVRRSARAEEGLGFVVWVEGLPSSGKSTVAKAVAEGLRAEGWRAEVLDGSETRRLIKTSAEHTRADRERRAARLGHLAHLLAENGAATLVPMSTPHEAARKAARTNGGERFVEVWLRCPLEECQKRDTKGLYRRAAQGLIPRMVGINDPFEPPAHADLIVDTAGASVEASAEKVLAYLADAHLR